MAIIAAMLLMSFNTVAVYATLPAPCQFDADAISMLRYVVAATIAMLLPPLRRHVIRYYCHFFDIAAITLMLLSLCRRCFRLLRHALLMPPMPPRYATMRHFHYADDHYLPHGC